ncbi:MAG: hypothetical protein R3B95_14350 [Nitrospirales bacterium]|nr:hypothetical protein [Nitrospirales bacterium]
MKMLINARSLLIFSLLFLVIILPSVFIKNGTAQTGNIEKSYSPPPQDQDEGDGGAFTDERDRFGYTFFKEKGSSGSTGLKDDSGKVVPDNTPNVNSIIFETPEDGTGDGGGGDSRGKKKVKC